MVDTTNEEIIKSELRFYNNPNEICQEKYP